jgi:predicted PurR-regulated permease PerM
MVQADETKGCGNMPARVSYVFMAVLGVLLVALHLGTLLLTALFAFLALNRLDCKRRGGKWLAVAVFLVLLSGAVYGLGYFGKQTVKALPEIADKAIPSIIQWARKYQIELPFTDYDSLKDAAFDTVRGEARYLGDFARLARGASTQVLFLLAGVVVAVSVFLNPKFELGRVGAAGPNNLYTRCCAEVARRFAALYRSFVTVMGAQIVISAVNTVLTGIFVLATQLPYAVVVIGVTFLCGLLPVVGNLVSNTIVVGIGFTVSPEMALGALVFLVGIHKLEYFLNSKIVGWRIQNPLWLTLLGLVIGEKLMGIPGMILAPVLLYYIKVEMSRVEVREDE